MFKTFCTLIFLFICCKAHAQQYTNLVLKGGGVRGIAYAGAIKVLEEAGTTTTIERVGGTSVGAITGALFAVGYSAKEIEEILFDLNIAGFNDGQWFFIGGQQRFRKRFGWYKGKKLEDWLGKMVSEKTGSENTTLRQLHQLALSDRKFKDLYTVATNLSKQTPEVFSWETFPDLPIKTAVRASMSIPLYYGAVFIDSAGNVANKPSKNRRYNVYADGGLVANYPIAMFNTASDSAAQIINLHTLGLKLERPEQIAYNTIGTGIAPYEIHTLRAYIGALYNLSMEQLNKGYSHEEERKHTIYISTSNFSPRVRHISDEQKRMLFENGVTATRTFLAHEN